MKDLFNTGLDQWFHLETKSKASEAAVKDNQEDIEFYAQLVRCAAEQAEVANAAEMADAVQYLKEATERLKELVELKAGLEEKAEYNRRAADAMRYALKSVATF